MLGYWEIIGCSLRSWAHEIFSHYRTVSRNLETTVCQNVALIVFQTQNTWHHAGKISEPHFDVLLFSNPREKVWKARKTMGPICPTVFLHFMTFSPRLEANVVLQCSSDSFPHMVIYILCVENCQNYISTHRCLPIAGRLFYNVRKLHGPRIWECPEHTLKIFHACKFYQPDSWWNGDFWSKTVLLIFANL